MISWELQHYDATPNMVGGFPKREKHGRKDAGVMYSELRHLDRGMILSLDRSEEAQVRLREAKVKLHKFEYGKEIFNRFAFIPNLRPAVPNGSYLHFGSPQKTVQAFDFYTHVVVLFKKATLSCLLLFVEVEIYLHPGSSYRLSAESTSQR